MAFADASVGVVLWRLIASIGIGTRMQLIDHLNGMVDVAVPLLTSVNTKAGQPRVEFKVWMQY